MLINTCIIVRIYRVILLKTKAIWKSNSWTVCNVVTITNLQIIWILRTIRREISNQLRFLLTPDKGQHHCYQTHQNHINNAPKRNLTLVAYSKVFQMDSSYTFRCIGLWFSGRATSVSWFFKWSIIIFDFFFGWLVSVLIIRIL